MQKLDKLSEDGFLNILNRQLGSHHPRIFPRRIAANEALVKSIDLYTKLVGHEGCVNTVEFNSTGDILVSGSDDRQIMLWDWATKKLKFSYSSGHLDNVFQAKFVPFTDDRRIVTSAADGKVRVGEMMEGGNIETKKLGKHQGRVHKLAVEPGSPYILYSCGEDGLVQRYDLRSDSATKLLYCTSLKEVRESSRSIKLNAIVIDPRNPNYFAVGGSDVFARVYDIRKLQLDASHNTDKPVDTFCPRHLIDSRDVHITALAYSNTSELIVSYNDELIYLFQKYMGLVSPPESGGSLQNLDEVQVFSGHRNSQTVKGVNFFGPNDDYVISGSDCGHIFMWKKKGGKLVRLMLGDKHIVNQLEPHPQIPVLATCGIEKTIKVWGPTSNDVIPLPQDVQEIMEANRRGREDNSRITLTPDVIMHVLRLHRRQALAYIERRGSRDDVESDDEGGLESYVLGYSDGDTSSEVTGNSTDCNVS